VQTYPTVDRARPLRVRLPEDEFARLVLIADRHERSVEGQAVWLLRDAIRRADTSPEECPA
jgi:plasmid stability protein